MFKLILILILSILFVSNKPISLDDKEIRILYVCSLEGDFQFDSDGRKGVPTLSELKRREQEEIANSPGTVFLFGNGNLMGKVNMSSLKKSISVSKIFDGYFLSEPELNHLEEIGLPDKKTSNHFMSHRENSIYIPGEKIYNIGNYKVLFSNINKRIEKKLSSGEYDLTIVFLQEGELPGEDAFFENQKPVVYIYSSRNRFQYTFHKKKYFAECPQNSEVGKLTVVFREGRMIRNFHEFISLNEIDRNNSWIKPDRKILKELEK